MAEKQFALAEKHNNEDADVNVLSVLPSEALAELTPAKRRMIFLYLTGQYTMK